MYEVIKLRGCRSLLVRKELASNMKGNTNGPEETLPQGMEKGSKARRRNKAMNFLFSLEFPRPPFSNTWGAN